jgi:hypothetical protein
MKQMELQHMSTMILHLLFMFEGNPAWESSTSCRELGPASSRRSELQDHPI